MSQERTRGPKMDQNDLQESFDQFFSTFLILNA